MCRIESQFIQTIFGRIESLVFRSTRKSLLEFVITSLEADNTYAVLNSLEFFIQMSQNTDNVLNGNQNRNQKTERKKSQYFYQQKLFC